MECFYNVTIPPDYDIDHKDANPLNNKFDNLQILTKKEHGQKTHKQNPDKGKKAAVKRSYRIVRFRIGENGERIDEVFFDSLAEATRKVKATQKRIRRSIEGGIPDSEGYHWANECDNDDLPGEEWLQVPGLREGMLVSNKGRVCYKYLPNPYKTPGTKTERGYFTFRCMNEKMGVHQAALLAFTGPPPTDDHTADHINRDRGNNCVGNLRWATKSEQAKNQERRIRPIEIYNPANPAVTIETFDTGREAAEEYGTSENAIYRAVHGTRGAGKDPGSARFINRERTLSARYADLTNEEKMNRELAFLDYQVEVAKKDKNKRTSNPENLPFGIYRNKATARRPRPSCRAKMTFLGKKYRSKSGNDPAVLVRERDEWFNKVVEDHKAFIRQSFDNNIPQ